MTKIASLSSRGIRYKLAVALCLMSVIPILVCLNYIFPSLFVSFMSKAHITFVIIMMLGIVMLGFVIIRQIFDPLITISHDAKLIAEGDTDRHIKVESDDEIGQLCTALNQITLKIKNDMNELKDYGSRTAQVNMEIQKRVTALASLLQISDLITRGEKLDDIMGLCVGKIRSLADSSVVFILFLEKEKFNIRVQSGLDSNVPLDTAFSERNECILEVFKKHTVTALDAKNPSSSCQGLLSSLAVKNLLCLPLFSHYQPIALLGIGNSISNFTYSPDEQEILNIFGKQITIAIENDLLMHRVEKLEIRDILTGLYNKQYIHNRLEEEISRAILYQRPCSFILSKINNFSAYQKSYGLIASEAVLKKVASCLGSAFSCVEQAGRFGDSEFAVVLPEKSKRQAQKIAEELQNKIECLFKDEIKTDKKLSLSTVVAENPLDGANAQDLVSYAQSKLPLTQDALI